MKSAKIQLILCLIIFYTIPAFSQYKKLKADKEYLKFNYALAIQHYLEHIEDKDLTVDVAENLADCYRLTSQSEKAEEWYGKVLAFNSYKPIDILHYAEALRNNGNYMEARNQFIAYGQKVPEEKEKATKMAEACDMALDWMANAEQVNLLNTKTLNTTYSEFSPYIYKERYFFTSDRKIEGEEYSEKEHYGWTGNPYLRIFETTRDSNFQWLTAKALDPEINTEYHNGPISISPDGKHLFLTRTNKAKNLKKVTGSKDKAVGFINRLEIFYATWNGTKWTSLQPFPYNNIKDYSVGHPAFSSDGKTLYFVSDMPGGFGESDLYYSERQTDSTWGKPVNLGAKINTSGKEVFPYVSEDKLYFSSNGHPGMGGLDLFSANGSRGTWSNVVNLKYPMNSSKDDFGLSLDTTGKAGLYSSNREGGVGGDDIYSFKQPSCILAGVTLELVDGQEKLLEDVLVKLFKKGDTTSVIAFERSGKAAPKKICLRSYEPCGVVYDAKGYFFFNLQPGVTYEIKASKQGYFTQSATITADCKSDDDTMKIALLFNKIQLNKPIVIKDLFFDDNDKLYAEKKIYYDLDKAEIRYDAAIELDRLVALLKDNPDIKIEMGSHTDSRASDDYNLKLSQKRAESTVRYLASKGIDNNKMTARGYGESKLLNNCKDGVKCSEKEHQLNRRTELIVTEIMNQDTHTVGPNETLFSISKKYKMTLEQLKALNNLDNNAIYVGDVLRIK
ncbi:MAG TPA: OmpA family protein [Cytophagaceae bacterium]|jgi:outer membrane protein OmpA-like peptidoglycan-associated protein